MSDPLIEGVAANLELVWRAASVERDAERLSQNEFEACLESLSFAAACLGVERDFRCRIASVPADGDRFNNARSRRKA